MRKKLLSSINEFKLVPRSWQKHDFTCFYMKTSSYYNEIIWVEQKKISSLNFLYKNVGLFSSSFFKNERKLHTVYERGTVQNRNKLVVWWLQQKMPFLLPKKLKTKSVRIFHPGDFGFLSYLLLCACFLSTPASNRRSLINGKKNFYGRTRGQKQNKPRSPCVSLIIAVISWNPETIIIHLKNKKENKQIKLYKKKEIIFLALVVLIFFLALIFNFFLEA